MSKWLGFFVGLALAITVVMTVVRPLDEDDDTPRTMTPATTDGQRAQRMAEALDGLMGRPPPAAADRQRSEPAPGAPHGALPAPPPAEPPPAEAHVPEPPTPEPPTPEPPTPAAAAVTEPIPDFDWGEPSLPPGTQVTPLPAPRVDIVAPGAANPPARADGVTRPAAAPATPAGPAAATMPPARVAGSAPSARPVAMPSPAIDPATETTAARQWYAFWRPFTSELSARGFSARLERITGLDYRVVRVDSGEYHVAFGYDDEQSRLANLGTIEAATGLRLGGGSL